MNVILLGTVKTKLKGEVICEIATWDLLSELKQTSLCNRKILRSINLANITRVKAQNKLEYKIILQLLRVYIVKRSLFQAKGNNVKG